VSAGMDALVSGHFEFFSLLKLALQSVMTHQNKEVLKVLVSTLVATLLPFDLISHTKGIITVSQNVLTNLKSKRLNVDAPITLVSDVMLTLLSSTNSYALITRVMVPPLAGELCSALTTSPIISATTKLQNKFFTLLDTLINDEMLPYISEAFVIAPSSVCREIISMIDGVVSKRDPFLIHIENNLIGTKKSIADSECFSYIFQAMFAAVKQQLTHNTNADLTSFIKQSTRRHLSINNNNNMNNLDAEEHTTFASILPCILKDIVADFVFPHTVIPIVEDMGYGIYSLAASIFGVCK
jgi:hypothetical protein